MTDNMLVRATERMAYGFIHISALAPAVYGPPTAAQDLRRRLSPVARRLGDIVFRTDAMARGYCMELWSEPKYVGIAA